MGCLRVGNFLLNRQARSDAALLCFFFLFHSLRFIAFALTVALLSPRPPCLLGLNPDRQSRFQGEHAPCCGVPWAARQSRPESLPGPDRPRLSREAHFSYPALPPPRLHLRAASAHTVGWFLTGSEPLDTGGGQ